MNGYQITFLTQQDRRHKHKPLAEWLMLAARDLGIRGVTIVAASDGYGQRRKIHSAHFFELADQPQEIVMAVTEAEWALLSKFLDEDGVHLFYIKTPVEFGVFGTPDISISDNLT